MSERIHFSPLGSTDAQKISRLQKKLFAPELTESEKEIEQILRNTETHMVCNLSFGLFDGSRMVGYAFVYIETRSLFHDRDEEVVYIKEIAVVPGYESYLRPLMQKVLAQRDAYAPGVPIEAHALVDALAAWRRLKRFFRSVNLQLASIAEPPKAGRPNYQLLRLDPVEVLPGIASQTVAIPAADCKFQDTAVSVVKDPRQWLALRLQWREILQSSGHSNVFQSFEYLWEWWKHFGIWNDLHMLVIRRGPAIIGIAPLMIEHIAIPGTSIRRMRLIGSLQDTARPQFLFGRDADICTSAMLAYLGENQGVWDVLSVEQPATGVGNKLCEHFRKRGHRVKRSTSSRAYVDLAGMRNSPEAKHGSETHRQGNRVVRTVTRWPALEAALDVHCAIEERNPDAQAGRGVSSDKDRYFFYMGLAREFGQDESFVSRILECDGTPVASTFGLLHQNVFQSLKSVHDEAYDAVSPQDALLAYELEDLLREGVSRYEFMAPPVAVRPNLQPGAIEVENIHVYQRQSPLLALYFITSDAGQRVRALPARARKIFGDSH